MFKTGHQHSTEIKNLISERTKQGMVLSGRKGKVFIKGQKPWNTGQPLSDAHRKQLSEAMKGKPSAMKGKKHSVETKKKISDARKGIESWTDRKHSVDSRIKMSKSAMGKVITEQTRSKLRVSAIEQSKRMGKPFPAVDMGSDEYFQFLNMYYGFLNIQYPNIEIPELGYYLDGYDPLTHTAYEYDTKHHLSIGQQQKDFNRQTIIINHFKEIGKPLTAFNRINATGVGGSEMKDVVLSTRER